MTRLQCPRCEKTIEAPAGGEPVCPHCGFTAPYRPQETDETPGAPSSGEGFSQVGGPAPEPTHAPPGPAEPAPYGSYHSQPYPQQAAYSNAAPARTSGMAVASLILGLVAVCFVFITWVPIIGWLSFGPAVLAVIFGGVGVSQCNRDPGIGGRGMAVAGLVLGIVVASIGLIFRMVFLGL